MAQPRLTFKRLVGIDRSGGPPPQTRRGAPLNPWTLPNAIGFVRLAALPVFLVLALGSGDGRDTAATVIYAAVAWGDQLDGLVARVTGQYSRLGTLLDPLTDRLLVVSGVVVCWKFELLPCWGLAILVAREVLMLALTQLALRRGMDLDIKMVGRWAVWPVMGSIGVALIWETWVSDVLLYVGIALTLWATALYVGDGWRELHRPSSSA
ncbi:MAG: CDP-alcohol phosphatidyltransferase family protein [Thermoleophilaceae bacterium]|nr:CDP-alcohol phosphatidyltransferase family protein [Thermoleophilaceae bacterium]